MRLVFVDNSPVDYDVGTPFDSPLGGTQSAACYLAIQLARIGHSVTFITSRSTSGFIRGVSCLAWNHATESWLKSFDPDACIFTMGPHEVMNFRSVLPPRARLIYWTGHAADQIGIQDFANPAIRDAFDNFVFISNWQRDGFIRTFAIDPARSAIIRYAVSPAFLDLFAPNQPILPAKAEPPILAYTSTPFRGLNRLLDMFPDIRRRVPGIRLQVFSSMKVYQQAPADEQARFGSLYDLCRSTAGVEYVGSLSQPQLAARLPTVSLLAYPNTFPETSCIALMEAMAAGCSIVTSDLGALSETAAGFGALIPILNVQPPIYRQQFIDTVVATLERRQGAANSSLEAHLASQVAFVNREYRWDRRAREWTDWLQHLPAR